MGIQVSKDDWMQILLESAEDSTAPLTAQCEEMDSSIVQLSVVEKCGGATGKRDARKKTCKKKRARCGKPEEVRSACGITSATLTYRWLARAARVLSFN